MKLMKEFPIGRKIGFLKGSVEYQYDGEYEDHETIVVKRRIMFVRSCVTEYRHEGKRTDTGENIPVCKGVVVGATFMHEGSFVKKYQEDASKFRYAGKSKIEKTVPVLLVRTGYLNKVVKVLPRNTFPITQDWEIPTTGKKVW